MHRRRCSARSLTDGRSRCGWASSNERIGKPTPPRRYAWTSGASGGDTTTAADALSAHVSKLPFASAVGHILELHQDVVGISERQLLGGWVRIGALPDRGLHAVRRQPLHHLGGVELLHAEAEVIDPAGVSAGGEGEELRPLANPDD